ncbi:MAG: hypothetical protein CMJ64_09270 [Planctomycetaceae bacterium]|nr:hypothetical protein [Planctomycetaceae bacterium]
MSDNQYPICPECDDVSRRDFVKVAGRAAIVAGVLPLFATPRSALSAPTSKSKAETTVKRLYDVLSDDQKKAVCMPYDHEKRKTLNPNWLITPQKLGSDFYTDEQRKIIDTVVRDVSSEDGYERFKRQMAADRPGGFGDYSIAIFGVPGSGQFEWVLTGRHLTLRADGDSVKNMAFGGPVVYGHGASDPAKNLFHFHTKAADAVFKAMDTKQREKALLPKAPPEGRVPIRGKDARFPGVAVSELSADQKELVETTIKIMLSQYRQQDVDEVIAVLKAGGGLEQLHMAFYEQGDLKSDNVWDIWRVEGPTFVWHFRGAPHVHTYINIGLEQPT